MADQVLQVHLHSVPPDAGGDDWHSKGARLRLHQAGAQDPGRRDARDDETGQCRGHW